MQKKHKETLRAIYRIPVLSNVKWADVESLLGYLGAEVGQGAGSRICFRLNGVRAVFHRPHPRKEIDKGALVSVRRFLENAGIKNDEI